MLQTLIYFGELEFGGVTIPLRIPGYGLMLVAGFMAGICLAQWRARRSGESGEVVTQCAILALLGGIIGSRIAYVIQHWEGQFSHTPNGLAAMLNLASGGLIYYGGVLLAIVLVVVYLASKGHPIRRYLDILAVSLMVGLAFGRIGCLLNGCCFGSRCDPAWPLGMRFPMYSAPAIKFDGKENPFSLGAELPSPVYSHQLELGEIRPDPRLLDQDGFLVPPAEFTPEQVAIARRSRSLSVQPAQLLSAANALVIAAILACFHRLRRREGQVFALMLVLYPITRFTLESIRDSNPHDVLAGVLTHNQYTSIIMFAAGAAMLWLIWRLPASAGATWPQRAASQGRSNVKVKNKSNRNRKR